jgi:hypothetical protein
MSQNALLSFHFLRSSLFSYYHVGCYLFHESYLPYVTRPILELSTVAHICKASYLEGWVWEDCSSRPSWANSSQNLIFKITRAKWTRSVAKVVECLPCKYKALSSNHSPTSQNKKDLYYFYILNITFFIVCLLRSQSLFFPLNYKSFWLDYKLYELHNYVNYMFACCYSLIFEL